MPSVIRKTAVLGAGVMGASLAAHFANAGIECVLLDVLPSGAPVAGGQSIEDASAWRNSLAVSALKALRNARPAAFFTAKTAALIRPGNLTDHLAWLRDVDWVLEAVVEDLKVKRELFARIENYLKPECIVSTNTSGLSVREIAAALSEKRRERFLGTHFFNPPRYLRLVELVPLEETGPEVVDFLKAFCEERLGKGTVICRDTPGFIANRLGAFDLATALRLMVARDLTVAEIDAVIGPLLGRAASAVFGTLDIVGLDVACRVMKNLHDNLPADESRDLFLPPDFVEAMLEKKWLGAKTRGGFYRRGRDASGGEVKEVLDYRRLEYTAPVPPSFASVAQARKSGKDAADTIRLLFQADDAAGQLVREYLCKNFIYAANRLGEICDDIVSIDRAMCWGYNHRLGPFEAWDAVGLPEAVAAMDDLRLTVPPKIREMLAAGFTSFSVHKGGKLLVYDFREKGYVELAEDPRVIHLASLGEQGKVVRQGAGASLLDLGDGVACFQFHSKMNVIDEDVIRMLNTACEIVEKDFLGLVIGNNDVNFSAGANLLKVLTACRAGDWELLARMAAEFQNVNMRLKYLVRPVMAAPAGLTLGGGCEIAMHTAGCQPCGESYIGLVETAVGVVPAGGGCKELMLRMTEGIPDGLIEAGLNLQHYYVKAFETIARAKVATSAAEAMELGFVRRRELVSMNRDRQLRDAKEAVLGRARAYRPPQPALIPVMGENFRGLAEALLYNMRQGDYISDYDLHVARKLAEVLSGGDCPEGTLLGEQEILDREREAFMSLCGEPKTQERIEYMLRTGKPLRN